VKTLEQLARPVELHRARTQQTLVLLFSDREVQLQMQLVVEIDLDRNAMAENFDFSDDHGHGNGYVGLDAWDGKGHATIVQPALNAERHADLDHDRHVDLDDAKVNDPE